MSLEYTQYGWRVHVRVPDPKTGQLKLRRKTFTEKKYGRNAERKAHAWEDKILAGREEIRDGINLDDPECRTVEGIAEEYFASSEFLTLKSRGRLRVLQVVRQFLRWNLQFGKPYVDQFTKRDADRYKLYVIDVLNAKGRGVQRRLLEANKILKRGGNASFGKVPRGKGGQQTVRAIEKQELDAMQSVMTEFERYVSDVLIDTGMRTGEFYNLRWTRVKPGFFIVEATADWDTKTSKSRSIPMTKRAERAFEYFRSMRKDDYVLPREIVEQDIHWFIRKFFNAIRQRTAEQYPDLREVLYERDAVNNRFVLTCHNYRKTFATRLYRKGKPVQYIQKLLGHSSIATTELYLADIMTESLAEAVRVLDEF